MSDRRDFDDSDFPIRGGGKQPWSLKISRQEVEAAVEEGNLLRMLDQEVTVTPEVILMIEAARRL
ncbi:MAG TPA: hypothetical protein VHD55_00470 [Candidatus Paceibacterota bacterium]|nr:hypothetical protein [Candidatus Paceibacterota bacterium]